MAVPPESQDLSAWAPLGAALTTVGGVIYAAFAFVSGTRAILELHEQKITKLQQDSNELRRAVDDVASKIYERIDANHARVMDAILQLSATINGRRQRD